MPDQPPYRSQGLDHLGLVAGMCDALGLGDIIDQATRQNPAMRDRTGGEAVKAMGLNGLGLVHQALSLVPRFFQHKPTSRLIAPRVAPAQRNDDALGRAWETLDAYGGTALYSRMAAPAAQRLGLCPRYAPLDSTSLHVAGRYNSDDAPSAHVVPIPQGSRRAHRPALHPGMRERMVEHHAGMPVLMQPRSGQSRDGQEFGQIVRAPLAQWHTTSGTTYRVADSALSSDDHRQKRAEPPRKWIARVPAPGSAAQAPLAPADPQAMAWLQEGYRYHESTSTYGGVEQRWVLMSSAPRQPPAQRPVDTP